jgi:hypothetical protein
LSQVLDRINETVTRERHQEINGGSVLAATEAVIELFDRTDRERRGFFTMEGTQAHPVGTPFSQFHVATDDIDDVNAGQQFLNEKLWDHSASEPL